MTTKEKGTIGNMWENVLSGTAAEDGSPGEKQPGDLAYRLDRKGWAKKALAYKSLVVAWPEITRLTREERGTEPVQNTLGLEG